MRRLVVLSAVALALLLLGLRTFIADGPDGPRPEPPPASDGVGEVAVGTHVVRESEVPEEESPLDRFRDLHGQVTDAAGSPVPGAAMVVQEYPRAALIGFRPGPRGECVRLGDDVTDETGGFRIRLPHSRQVAVRVTAKGFAPLSLFPCYSGERLHLTLRRAARLTVRVIHADQSPAASAWVRVGAGKQRSAGSYERKGVADLNGEIVFDDVPTGVPFSLKTQAVAPGAFTGKTFTPLGRSGRTVALVIPVGPNLRGYVRDARTGAAIVGASVSPGTLWPRSARTSEDGGFTLHGWTGKEDAEMTVEADGYATRKVVANPDQVRVIDLVPGLTITGRVLAETQEPIPGAEAAVTGSRYGEGRWSSTYGDTLTDARGRFTVPGIDGTFPLILKVEVPGYGRREIDLEVPDQEERGIDVGDIVLSSGGTIAGRVVTTDGGVARRMYVWLQGPKTESTAVFGRLATRLTDDLGRFVFPDLESGSYYVYVRPRGTGRTSTDVVLDVKGTVEDVVLAIAPQWSMRVAVRNERGEPVVGIRVVCRTRSRNEMLVMTDEQGIAAMRGSGIPDRVTTEGVDQNGVAWVGREMSPSVRDRREMTILVEAAGQVSGVVNAPDGKPIAGAIVEVRRSGSRLAVAIADEGGRFTVPVPANGTTDLVFDGMVRKTSPTGGWSDSPVRHRGRREGVRAGESDLVIAAAGLKFDGSLVVSVVSDRHIPMPGVRVVVEDRNAALLRSGFTGPDGKCLLPNLPRFEVRVGIDRIGGPAAFARFALADGRRVELQVPDERLVIGRVEGVLVQGGRIILSEEGVGIGAAEIVRNGSFCALLDRTCRRLSLVAVAVGRDNLDYEGTAENVLPGARDVAVILGRKR